MITTRTPLRISLMGGGTDIPEFYHKEYGAVVSFGIDKYVYVSVNDKFDGYTRVSYSQTENVKNPSELQHDLVRETLAHFDLRGLEITSISDIPGEGSGLGSSSSFTVGLCRALIEYMDTHPGANFHPSVYADLAFGIERGRCEHPVGKQDHYAAAYGGVHYYQFNPDDKVIAELLPLESDQKFFLKRDLMLFWTGQSRKASPILAQQADRMEYNPSVFRAACFMRDMAIQMRDDFRRGDISNVGRMLHEGWMFKKSYAIGVTDTALDMIYDRARKAGALGGKLCGAGGGGFFLFAVPPEYQHAVHQAVGLRQVPFNIVDHGSEIIYKGETDE